MGVWSWLFRKQLTKLLNDIEKSYGSSFYQALLKNAGGGPVYIPDKIESYINDGYLFNPTVYSVISFISQKAGAIPWGIYEVKDEKALNLYKSASPDLGIKREIIKTKALIEIEDHELSQLFVSPNVLQGWADFFEQVVGFKLVTGNSYIHCIGPTNGVNAGLVKELWTLPSQIVTIVPGDKAYPIDHYEMLGERTVNIPPEQIIHLKYWTPRYANAQFLYGVSPITAGRRVITKSNSSYDASVSSFQNMGAYGILSPAGGEVQSLTEEQQDMLEQRFKKKTGPNNAGKPLISSIPLTWQQTGLSPVDMNIIESDKMDLRTICNLFHVPSELFNDASNKTYSNTKEAGSAVYTNAVIPALVQFRDSFNQFIKPRYQGKVFIDFDISAISELQEDMNMQVQALGPAWWITPNEKRIVMGYGADEDNPLMDEYFVPAGVSPLSGTPPDDMVLEEVEKMLKIK